MPFSISGTITKGRGNCLIRRAGQLKTCALRLDSIDSKSALRARKALAYVGVSCRSSVRHRSSYPINPPAMILSAYAHPQIHSHRSSPPQLRATQKATSNNLPPSSRRYAGPLVCSSCHDVDNTISPTYSTEGPGTSARLGPRFRLPSSTPPSAPGLPIPQSLLLQPVAESLGRPWSRRRGTASSRC